MNVRFSFRKFAADTVDDALQQLMRCLVEPDYRNATVASISHAYGPSEGGGNEWTVLAVLEFPEPENRIGAVEVP